MKKRIYLPIEIIIRELDSKLLLAIFLLINSKNDWEVIIGNNKKMGKYINKRNNIPFIWLDKGVEANDLKLKKIISNNGKSVLLDEEGAIYTKKHEKYPRGLKINNALPLYEKILFWGEETYQKWIKMHKNIKPENLLVTGNPRFDLSKKKFIEYFSNLNPDVPKYNYTLISSAFGNGNPNIPIDENYKNYWNKINAGTVNSIDFEITDYQKRLFNPFMKGIEKLVKKFPNEKFILRPHPFENINTYKQFFKNLKNITVIYSGAIQEWFPNAKLMIHSGCTTAIEGFYNDLNPICYAPIEGHGNEQFTTFEISNVARDDEDLFSLFKNQIDNNNQDLNFEKKVSFIKYYIDNYGSKNSYDSITNIIDEISFEKIDIKLKSIERFKMLLPNSIYNFISYTKNYLVTSKSDKKYKKNMKLLDFKKFPKLSKSDIEIRVFKLLSYFNFDNSIDISELSSNIFLLRKNK